MRFLVGFILLLAAGTAFAKPSPVQTLAAAPKLDDGAIYLGPAGALLESDYFGVPQPRQGLSRVFPCRLHLRVIFSKTRLAQFCE